MANPHSSKILTAALLFFVVLNTSCRKEEFEFIDTPTEQAIQPDTRLTNLILRTTSKDGSEDNIVDRANCFTLQFPYSVVANGVTVTITNKADLDIIEDIFEADDADTDVLEIEFPVSIVFDDFKTASVNNQSQLDALAANCPGEGADDPDIECIDFVYPIRISLYNRATESLSSRSFQNDEDLYNFIDELLDDDIVTLEFPITLRLADNTEVIATDPDSLENTLDSFKDSCDEDDDFDYDDDDCEDCSPGELITVFSSCNEWIVESFQLGGAATEDNYTSFAFDFQEGGTLVITSNTDTFFGTWTAIGIGNSITVSIEIPALPEFTGDWRLNEVSQENSQGKVKLILGSDRLTFDNACLSGNTTGNAPLSLEEAIVVGAWSVDSYLEGTEDRTAVYSGYNFTFNNTGEVTADNGTPVPGTWNQVAAAARLTLDFGNNPPLDAWNHSWVINAVSETEISVSYINTMSGGRNDILTLRRN